MEKALKCAVALACFALLLLVLFLGSSAREASQFKNGAASGFDLNGYYTAVEGGSASAAFLSDESVWQLVDGDGVVFDGTFLATEDPNIYILLDSSGRRRGYAHLAFTTKDGTEGLLYLALPEEAMALEKRSKVPAFVDD